VPFFTDIALLARIGGDFVPCQELLAYNQAVSLHASEAKRKLRPLFEITWFCQLLVPRVKLNPLPIKECVGILAVEAKAGEDHIKRVEPLIKFLEIAGIVAIVDGMVSFVPCTGDSPPPRTKQDQGTDKGNGATPPRSTETIQDKLLAKFPSFDPQWPEELQKKWFASFEEFMKVANQTAAPQKEKEKPQ
jgi:hypothetical protein